MKKNYLDIKNIIILILVILLSLVSFDPFGIMPNRTKTVEKIVKVDGQSLHPIHDTIGIEVPYEVEVEVPVEVEKPVPYAVHDTIQAVVDTNFIVNNYLNSKNVFVNTYKFDKQQGSITITDTISQNKLIGRKYTTKITPRVDTLKIPEPFKRKVFFGLEGGFNSADFVNFIGAGVLINSKSDKIYNLGVGVNNTTTDGTNCVFNPYIKGGVYWKIKLKK
jgi:hypothetical protein